MPRLRPITAFVLSLGLLQSCASPPKHQGLKIEPIMQVNHSAMQSSATYYQLGKYYQERGEFELAISSYTQALVMYKGHFEARNALATVYSQQGKLTEAEAALRTLISERPDVAHLYNNLGYVNYLQGNYEAAAFALDTALAFDPGNERARNNREMVQAAMTNGQHNQAELSSLSQTPKDLADKIDSVSDGQNVASNAAATAQPLHVSRTVQQVRDQSVPVDTQKTPNEQRIEGRTELVELMPSVYALKSKKSVPIIEHVAVAPVPAISSHNTTQVVERKTLRLEIANSNGVTGITRQLGRMLVRKGLVITRFTNDRLFQEKLTRIEYGHRFAFEAAILKDVLRGQAVLVEENKLDDRADVRVVMGKDVAANVAETEQQQAIGPLAAVDAY